LIASLGVVVLVLATNETFGRSGTAHGGSSASRHSSHHASLFRPLRRHRRNNVGGVFWPGDDGDFYGPGNGVGDVAPPVSGDTNHTYTYDVPWDAVHRFPPSVAPSQKPYVPECTAQTITVPQHDGAEKTVDVNITRCY
jgi:hypothetical protein